MLPKDLFGAPSRRRGSTKSALLASALTAFGIAGLSFPAASQSLSNFTLDHTTATTGTMSVAGQFLGNSSLGSGNIASTLAPGGNSYNYVATTFTVQTAGTLSFGQSAAPSDTVMILYRGTFDPTSPATNALSGNDDFGGSRPNGVTVERCGSSASTCPQVSGTFTSGETVTLVVSTFGQNRSLGTPVSPDLTIDSAAAASNQLSRNVGGAPVIAIYADAQITFNNVPPATTFRNLDLNTSASSNNIAIAATGGSITGAGGTYTLSGVLSGAGALSLLGTGSITLSSANTLTGQVSVAPGLTLSLSGAGSLASASGLALNGTLNIGSTTSGATLNAISGAGDVVLGARALTLVNPNGTLSGVISGTAGVSIAGGTLTLTGANTYTGATTIGSGATLQIGSGGTTGAIAGNVTNNGTLAFNRSDSATYSGAISGTGGVSIAGGTLTLTGANTYTGRTSVQGGLLSVNGSIASSSVSVGNGGTLGGIGTVGGVTLASGGTLAPGNSIGTLNVSGNVALAAGSVYLVEIQGSQADKTVATGTAAVAGTLRVVSLDGKWPRPPTTYRILSATGGVSGTFGTVTLDNAPRSVRFNVTYGTTDVDLMISSVTFAEQATSRNQRAVGVALDRVAEGPLTVAQSAVLNTLYAVPEEQTLRSLSELSGEVHTAAIPLATRTAGLFLQTMLDPARQGSQPAGACGEGAPRQTASGQAAHCHNGGQYTVWVAPFVGNGMINGDRGNGSSGRAEQIAGMAVGADMRIDANSMVGFALGGASAQAKISTGLGSLNSDVAMAGLYGAHNVGPLSLGAAIGYSAMEAETRRSANTVGVNRLESDYTVSTWSGRIQAAYALIQEQDFSFGPYAFAQAFNVNRPSFQEKGANGAVADLGVSSASRSATDSQTELGLQLLNQGQIGAMPASAFMRAGWRYALSQSDDFRATITSLPTSGFTILGAQGDEHMASIGAGLDLAVAPGVSVGGRVDSLVGANTSFVTGSVRLRVEF
jgi:autotransporter-associated beta strand protein